MASESKPDLRESILPEDRNIGPSTSQKPTVGSLGIYFAYAIVIIPLTALSISLLSLVFDRRVHEPQLNTILLTTNYTNDNGVYYVQISAPTLLLLASYSSTVMSTVVSFFMVLVSYVAAREILKQLKTNRDNVPNSTQFGVRISTLGGGLGPLWTWVKYIFQSKKEKIPSVLKISGLLLVFILTFSILITLADTWLHVSTETVELPILSTNSNISNSFGRGISPFCAQWYADPANMWPNIPKPCVYASSTLPGELEVVKLINGLSTENQVLLTTHNGTTYAILGDAQASSSLDFVASTVAISTQCTAVSNACYLQQESLKYNCSSEASGYVGSCNPAACDNSSSLWTWAYYNDTAMTQVTSYIFPNPVYVLFGLLLAFYDNTSQFYYDPEVAEPTDGGEGILVLCTATTYEITYNWINGSIANLVNVTLSNDTLSGMLNGYNLLTINEGVQFEDGANLAGATSNTSKQFVDQFALVYSKTALKYAVGMFSARENLEEQFRDVRLVAQVTKAPLYSLVVLNLLVVLIGGIVGFIAIWYSTKDGVKEARERLTEQGLIKNAVEKPLPGRAKNRVVELFENI